ncbi:MAG: hypothetical protein QM504_13355, partial [Pseudomonadota bacterium]
MKGIFLLCCVNLLIFIHSVAYADKFVSEHMCFKPDKPLFMASAYYQKSYQKDISDYNFCMNEFIKGQEKGILTHQQAIKKATNDW